MLQIGHNCDDIVDINVPVNYAFNQVSPREFYVFDVDGKSLETGQELICYAYPELKFLAVVHIIELEVRCAQSST